ncbi:glycoside hydrolase family 32 protein [Lacticaseibacillus camelliae]|uniref:glycoside hydrolase family 32 protein n=1 Tax=Lacticaseibacillus camelliae TaxID=381742 RepID=UPI0006D06F89|nr:glycoside hydrolase family 32 protein [Lacticaseibacillus camelliae]
MLEGNSDLRSTPYQNYSPAYLATLEAQQQRSRWRLGYHIQPRSGLINDPNGFAYFANQWHLFKQQFPFGPVHGLKSWGHLTSNDLAHWQDQGTALHPHSPYTTNGVYSGSALPVKDRLFMMYTGNVRTADGGRRTTQLGAWMERSGHITELAEPLIAEPPAGYTSHFRDPQLIEHNGTYYALIGAQRADKQGQILLYTAAAPTGPWQLIGPLDFGRTTLGEMIECPNLAFVDGQVALLFCPQGMAQRDCAYQNVYPNTVVVAAGIDWQNAALIVPSPLRLLDEGFDAYAGHVVNRPNGEALMIAWMGLPDLSYPSDQEAGRDAIVSRADWGFEMAAFTRYQSMSRCLGPRSRRCMIN